MKTQTKITDFYFTHKLRTRWRDCDAFRHINNATYLSYIEDARLEFMRRWGITQDGKSVIVASVKIDYYKQVVHPTELIILGSKDGKSYYIIGDKMLRKTGRSILNVSVNIDSVVRYVKVIAKNQIIPDGFNGAGNPAWIFLDEVQVN